MQTTTKLVPKITLDLIDRIPGQLNDRRTMLGELNWIFTAITDTIAWNTLPRGKLLFWHFVIPQCRKDHINCKYLFIIYNFQIYFKSYLDKICLLLAYLEIFYWLKGL